MITYTLAVLTMVMSPGPNFLLLCHNTIGSGLRVGISTAAGVSLSSLVHGTLAIAGVAAVISNSQPMFTTMQLLGATYLLYLGLRSIISNRGMRQKKDGRVGQSLAVSARTGFLQGFITGILNPYTTVFYLVLLPQFAPLNEFSHTNALVIMVAYAAGLHALWFGSLALCLQKTSERVMGEHLLRKLQLASGSVLIFLGLNFYRVAMS